MRSFDAVLEGPHPHVLIEHLEGPSLRRLIKRDGAIPLEQLLPLAAHVAGALQYMAQAGYVHLDVKPDNIVMGVPPRLIDLSIARTVERAAQTEGPIGTDAYMAPEQCVAEFEGGPIGPGRRLLGPGRDALPRRSAARSRSPKAGGEGAERFPQLRAGPEGRCPLALPATAARR